MYPISSAFQYPAGSCDGICSRGRGAWSKNSRCQNLKSIRFANDISLLAESEIELQHLVDGVSQTSTRFGLIVSKPKTEVQCVGKGRQQTKIMLEDEELKQVENFVYLGGTVLADQLCDKDIQRRIGLAAGIVRNLDKNSPLRSAPMLCTGVIESVLRK